MTSHAAMQGEPFVVRPPCSTKRIASVLRNYAEGVQVLQEILQNSDDAGATTQVFCLDHRAHPAENLITPELRRLHDVPSLISFNDAIFRDRDFKSLMSFQDSEKREDTQSIGRFGLGFSSVYHICDEVQFLSGDFMVFLDPHQRVLPDRQEGLKFNVVTGDMQRSAPGQLSPFRSF